MKYTIYSPLSQLAVLQSQGTSHQLSSGCCTLCLHGSMFNDQWPIWVHQRLSVLVFVLPFAHVMGSFLCCVRCPPCCPWRPAKRPSATTLHIAPCSFPVFECQSAHPTGVVRMTGPRIPWPPRPAMCFAWLCGSAIEDSA